MRQQPPGTNIKQGVEVLENDIKASNWTGIPFEGILVLDQ